MAYWFRSCLLLLLLATGARSLADEKVYPDKPNPPRLVNDYAHMLNPGQDAQLERKLDDIANSTSTQISIITVKNLNGQDVEEYAVEVFNRWGLGQAGKNNGVLLVVSLEDHKAWITVGQGLQGVLTDAKAGLIFRNELVPAFRQQDYFKGLSDAADAIIAVTKDEYKSDGLQKNKPGHFPITAIIILIIIIVFIIRIRRGGGGGGNYMSGGGFGDFATGMILGNLLGGGRSGGGGWGGGDSGGGGFGGFGGGSTDGGGAGGSW